MEQQLNITSITSLPDEIIALILKNNNCIEIMRFGSTCKKFYDLVRNHQLLWKDKLRDTIPINIYHHIISNNSSNFYKEIKIFYNIKNIIYKEILLMSPKYYWQRNEIDFKEVIIYFNIALANPFSYYYTIYILQELIRVGNRNLNKFIGIKPYTLTEIYYARLILCHLIYTYLTVKWFQHFINDEYHPEFLLNFFVQWADPVNMHPEEEVETIIANLVTRVEKILVKQQTTECKPGDTIKAMSQKGQITEYQVLAAVQQVIYHQPHMGVAPTANLESLDIVKVMNNKCGHEIVLAVMYQAVARQCGVYCNLITLPNQKMLLEYRDTSDSRHLQTYTINLVNGELQPWREEHVVSTDYEYYPITLLQYIYAMYKRAMEPLNNNWHVPYLIDFTNFDSVAHNNFLTYNPYNSFLKILLECAHLPSFCIPIDITKLYKVHRDIISIILTLCGHSCSPERPMRSDIKKRDSRVKYAVGMICFNRLFQYACVIRGWDLSCTEKFIPGMHKLEDGLEQPCYHVVAMDQSKRYAAQESLAILYSPSRLHHLEDILGKEFSHFNGFAYVPNDEKLAEYPADSAIVSVYQNQLGERNFN